MRPQRTTQLLGCAQLIRQPPNPNRVRPQAPLPFNLVEHGQFIANDLQVGPRGDNPLAVDVVEDSEDAKETDWLRADIRGAVLVRPPFTPSLSATRLSASAPQSGAGMGGPEVPGRTRGTIWVT